MTQFPNQRPQVGSRVNDIVVDVLSASVLILAAMVSIAQFAYY